VVFVLKTKWELFALDCAGWYHAITGSAAVFGVTMIHCGLCSLRLVRRWEGRLNLHPLPSCFRKNNGSLKPWA